MCLICLSLRDWFLLVVLTYSLLHILHLKDLSIDDICIFAINDLFDGKGFRTVNTVNCER